MNLEAEMLSHQADEQKIEKRFAPNKKQQKIAPKAPKKEIAALIIIAFLFITWHGLVYSKWEGDFARIFTAIVPFPVATINGDWITYKEMLDRVDFMRFFSDENDSQFAEAIDLLLRKQALIQLADSYDIKISNEEFEQGKEEIMDGLTKSQFEAKINSEVHMTSKEFFREVLTPLLLAKKLENKLYSSETAQLESKEKIYKALSALDQAGSFAGVAYEFSEDLSSGRGGDVGYFNLDTLPAGWEPLLDLSEMEHSQVIETEQDFVILMPTKIIGEGEDVQIRASAIVVKKNGLDVILDKYMKESDIKHIIKLAA